MRHRVGALIAFAVVTLAVPPAAALEGKAVVLQGLDKVTRVSLGWRRRSVRLYVSEIWR